MMDAAWKRLPKLTFCNQERLGRCICNVPTPFIGSFSLGLCGPVPSLMASSALILKHSGRTAQLAHADRYSLIRTFFTRPTPQSPSFPLTRRPASVFAPTFTPHRSFHSSWDARDNRPSMRATPQRTEPLEQRQTATPNSHTTYESSRPDNPTTNLHHNNYPRFFRQLAQSLPHVSRPSRDDFLNAANGIVQRMRVRVRWFFIRNFRKFNADDISAFVTWFLVGQGLWILIGTSVGNGNALFPKMLIFFSFPRTTFFSVVFAVTNSLRLQGICARSSYGNALLRVDCIAYVARAISDYLTSETGVSIIFESAIVPKWKDSRISFKNVHITRRPKTNPSNVDGSGRAVHAAALGYDVSDHPANHTIDDEEDDAHKCQHSNEDIEWSMFDLNVDSIDVTLSLARWLDGKGLVKDAVVKGVRGVLGAHLVCLSCLLTNLVLPDRRSVQWSPDLDPASFRNVAQQGDFELESLALEDVLITVYQPGGFRPYTFSIFRADVGMLRKQWLFHDFMKAEGVVGQFDNCLFSLHRPQSMGRTNEQDAKDGGWSTMVGLSSSSLP
jgi:mitochondrial distribution and morphology protein 31